MLKPGLITVALLATTSIASAQPQPQLQPAGAGGQLQQIPPAPPPARNAPAMDVVSGAPSRDPAAGGEKVRVSSLRVTGNTLFSEERLIAAAGLVPGSELTLAELRDMAARISGFYNDRGYFLAQAYLPAQDVSGGAVTVAVVEGRYGTTGLTNSSGLSGRVPNAILGGIDSGDPVAAAGLERRLLLLSDIPGVVVRSTLSPGAAVGTSDLLVALTPGRLVTGSVEADNGGSRYTGAYRAGGTINFNNPMGIGDRASLRLLGSSGGLAYGRAAWQLPVGDGTLGLAFTHLRYDLGREFSGLDAGGTANIFSLFGSYPLVRSRTSNLFATFAIDARNLEDRIGLVSSESDKTARALTIGLSGDSTDRLGGGGWNAFSAGWTFGRLHIENPIEREADALAGRTEGGYSRLQVAAARLQTVTRRLSLYASVRGQLAFANLDSSERMELGGAHGVRAFPEGEAYGDQGYVATLEGRLMLSRGAGALPGQLQLIAFVDTGAVDHVRDAWAAGSNRSSRSGIGAGLVWSGPDHLVVRATYAHALGDSVTTSGPHRSGRFWFQVARPF
ncbi:ShlB/FhaC/HecB family hemolysin secretion/activation protein [Allosphingosinicella sp.]|jgi:hemolysin activation/secretion protein|uniref:ShlB/FhaC/HecB family hemolysin secretion/activation protein n=1 Tax=Allosphingosinicella sp. TaxID=2823234 RepID=UPI002EF57C7B